MCCGRTRWPRCSNDQALTFTPNTTTSRAMADTVEIWTDGACSGNPGPGGWGVLVRTNGKETELYGGDPATTNNRMELMAAIVALESQPKGAKAILHTDSQYV